MSDEQIKQETQAIMTAIGQVVQEFLAESFGQKDILFAVMAIAPDDTTSSSIATNCTAGEFEEALRAQLKKSAKAANITGTGVVRRITKTIVWCR